MKIVNYERKMQMKSIKRDTSGQNFRIKVDKATEGYGIPCMLCAYPFFIDNEREMGWYMGCEKSTTKGMREEQRAGTTVVSKQELINAIHNTFKVPYIRINDGFSVRSLYSVYHCNNEEVFKKIGCNDLLSLPDTLYRITIFYLFNDENEEWEEGKAIIDVMQ